MIIFKRIDYLFLLSFFLFPTFLFLFLFLLNIQSGSRKLLVCKLFSRKEKSARR